jgi:serine/threonine-protein kinase
VSAGDVLGGRYRIEASVKIRRSDVYFNATDTHTGTSVAVHLLVAPGSTEALDQSCVRANLLDRGRRVRELTGPHVAHVLDVGMTLEGHPWIARERITSPTVGAVVRAHGALPMRDAVDVTLAVCDALAEAHAARLVHGSMGPHAVHVELTESGASGVKVTGIGTAQPIAALTLGATGEVDCIVRSPEQLRHGAITDARTDVWATAVLLYTMIAGASPFAADTPSGASLSVILDDPPPLTGQPADLDALVRRALSKDPTDRPQSMLELAEGLTPFARHPDLARERIAARRRDMGLPCRPSEPVPPRLRTEAPAAPRRQPGRLLRAVGLFAGTACAAALALVAVETTQAVRAAPRGDERAHAAAPPPVVVLEVPPDLAGALPAGASLRDPRAEHPRRPRSAPEAKPERE